MGNRTARAAGSRQTTLRRWHKKKTPVGGGRFRGANLGELGLPLSTRHFGGLIKLLVNSQNFLSNHRSVRTRDYNRLACLHDARCLRRTVIRHGPSRNSKPCHCDPGYQRQHDDLEVRRAISAVNRMIHPCLLPPALVAGFVFVIRRQVHHLSVNKRRNGPVVSLVAITRA
jgi:hypothetical protein